MRSYGTEPQVWDGDPACEHERWVDQSWRDTRHGTVDVGDKQATNTGSLSLRVNGGHRSSAFCRRCGAWRGEHGLEPSFDLWLRHEVEIFRAIRRVLRDDGTAWVNVGDAYASSSNGAPADQQEGDDRTFRDKPFSTVGPVGGTRITAGTDRTDVDVGGWGKNDHALRWRGGGIFKPKDRLLMPARLMIALHDDGWWVRDEIVWCLSPSTVLYVKTPGREGPMSIHDLIRLKPADAQLWTGARWSQVLGWSATRTNGPPLRLRLRSGETINCTAAHRWPTADGRTVAAAELKIGDVLATRGLPQPEAPSGMGIDLELAWFAGLYLAEGSMSDDAIQIAGGAHEMDRHHRTADIARRFGGSAVHHHLVGKSVLTVVHGAMLHGAIRHFVAGKDAHTKHLHPRAWNCSNALLEAFLQGYLEGDGHWDTGNDRWRLGFCRNERWAGDLRVLAARLGFALTLNPSFAKIGRARSFESFRGEIRLIRREHWNNRDRAEIVAIERSAEGLFYDIGIADEPHLFALASGVLTHNSKRNPMPSSVRDRTTPAHEMLYMLSVKPRYFWDRVAIYEPFADGRMGCDYKSPDNWDTGEGAHGTIHRQGREKGKRRGTTPRHEIYDTNHLGLASAGAERDARRRSERNRGGRADGFTKPNDIDPSANGGRSKRSVWELALEPFTDETELVRQVRVPWDGDADGKRRIASPDCPAHRSSDRRDHEAGGDGHAGLRSLRTPRSDGRRDPTLSDGEGSSEPCTCEWYVEKREKVSHFATAPTALVRPCVLAGTSARGVCPKCGAPWMRVVKTRYADRHDCLPGKTRRYDQYAEDNRWGGYPDVRAITQSTGFRPACHHYDERYKADFPKPRAARKREQRDAWPGRLDRVRLRPGKDWPVKPATVLDPFGGAGTTALVAQELGRDAILIELHPGSARLARTRLRKALHRVEADLDEDTAADLPLFRPAE